MSWTHERARIASLSRSRTADDPELVDARRNMRVDRAEDYLRNLIEGWPAPSAAQRDRLALLLRGGDAEPPGEPTALGIRRNTSAEAVTQPRRKSRELSQQAQQAESELSALGGASA